MKFTATILRLAAVVAATTAAVEAVTEQEGCRTDEDPSHDFFPVKVSVEHSQYWSIEYFNSYKIVRNLNVTETYLLYQCGTEPPTADELGMDVTQTIEIPVTSVGVDQTPTIPFLEHLGLVDNIVAFTSDPQWVSSPCLLESIEDGNVIVVQDTLDDFGAEPDTTDETLALLQSTLGIVHPLNDNSPFTNSTVKFSEYRETTNAGIFEWIKFVSVFFNLEEKANQVFDTTQERWNCVTENAQRVSTDSPDQPTVLWLSYSDYCGGWSVTGCPNYYCEYATQCSTNFLTPTDPGTYVEKCDAFYYLDIDPVVELGQEADYWFYPETNWNATYALFQDQLDQFKAVQTNQVYDFQASGSAAWFEQRYAEYFAVLQDFCSIVGTTQSFTGRSWFRNVVSGTVGDVGECSETSRSNTILPVADGECEDLSPPGLGLDSGSTVAGLKVGSAWKALLALVAVVGGAFV